MSIDSFFPKKIPKMQQQTLNATYTPPSATPRATNEKFILVISVLILQPPEINCFFHRKKEFGKTSKRPLQCRIHCFGPAAPAEQ